MSTPPPPPGQPGPQPNQPGPYGQQPPGGGYGPGGPGGYGPGGPGGYGPGGPGGYGPGGPGQGGSPYGPPPKKGGVPMWAWIVGGIVAVILLCVCGIGGLGLVGVLSSDDTTTRGPTEATTSESTEPTTDEPTTTDPPTTEPTTTSTTEDPTTTSSTSTLPGSSAPPPPEGSTANTNSKNKLPTTDLEKQVAKGMSGLGHTQADIYCQEELVLIKGRTTSCTAPTPGDSGQRSDVDVEVAWAVLDSNNRISYYLTFRQKAS